MKLYIVFALFLAFAACVHSQAGTNFYCGRHLSRTLAILCWGQESKRDAGLVQPPENVKALGAAPQAAALGGVRVKRGPVDECCLKPCSIDDLLTYC